MNTAGETRSKKDPASFRAAIMACWAFMELSLLVLFVIGFVLVVRRYDLGTEAQVYTGAFWALFVLQFVFSISLVNKICPAARTGSEPPSKASPKAFGG